MTTTESELGKALPPTRYALYQILESKSIAGLVREVNEMLYAAPIDGHTAWDCFGSPMVVPGGHWAQAMLRRRLESAQRMPFYVTCTECLTTQECLNKDRCQRTGKELTKGLMP